MLFENITGEQRKNYERFKMLPQTSISINKTNLERGKERL